MSNLKGTLTALSLLCFVAACGGSDATPPKYPYPEPRPVEETELGIYLDDEEDALEDDFESDHEDELDEAAEEEAPADDE